MCDNDEVTTTTTTTNGMTLAEACAMVTGAETAAATLTAWRAALVAENVVGARFLTGLTTQIETLTAATAAA